MENNENTLAPLTQAAEIVNAFSASAPAFFCSFAPKSDAEKVELYNAMNAPDVKLSDHIGQEINMRDVIIEPVEIQNEDGTQTTAPRIIIIDTDGNSYHCVSTGIYNALRRLAGIFGAPTWQNGLKVKVKQLSFGSNRVFTLDAVV